MLAAVHHVQFMVFLIADTTVDELGTIGNTSANRDSGERRAWGGRDAPFGVGIPGGLRC